MNRRNFLRWSAAGGAAFIAGDMLVEAQRLEVTRHRIAIGAVRDTLISAVQITDLHLQRFGRHEANIARESNDARPDFMLLTGDSIDDKRKLDVRGKTLRLAGFDDYIGNPHLPRHAIDDVSPVDAELLLAHCPKHRDVITDRKSLMLSGHTHGGQINFGGSVNFTPPGSGVYLKGWYLEHTVFVSRGLGTSRVPLRLNSVPELVHFEFLV